MKRRWIGIIKISVACISIISITIATFIIRENIASAYGRNAKKYWTAQIQQNEREYNFIVNWIKKNKIFDFEIDCSKPKVDFYMLDRKRKKEIMANKAYTRVCDFLKSNELILSDDWDVRGIVFEKEAYYQGEYDYVDTVEFYLIYFNDSNADENYDLIKGRFYSYGEWNYFPRWSEYCI